MPNYSITVNPTTTKVTGIVKSLVPQEVIVRIQEIYNLGGGGSGEVLRYTAGEQINSHMPMALVGNRLFRFDNTNPNHQFSFVGFSKVSGNAGELMEVETNEITFVGWGLTPNKQYLGAANGGMQLVNNTPGTFTRVLGVAQNSNTLLILKNYLSILKS